MKPASRIRSEGYTHLLDLHDNLRSRVLRALAPGPWRRYPMYRAARALLIHAKRDRYPVRRPIAERYFAAARGLDVHPDGEPPEFFLSPRAANEVAIWEHETGLGTSRPLVAVAPGAAHATKRWPTEHWRVLVDRIVDSGMDVAVVGGPADQAIAEAVAAGRGDRSRSAAGLFGLQATGAILRRARALVSGDTGVMHMATGCGHASRRTVRAHGRSLRVLPIYSTGGGGTARPRLPSVQQSWRARVSAGSPPLPRVGRAGDGLRGAVPERSMSDWDPAATALLSILTVTGRGPRREGIFALWLTVRIAQDLLREPPPSERAHRKRLQALEHRLSSLTIPPPLRRALVAAISQLREARSDTAAQVLSQLVAPARDTGGVEAGDALAQAARSARAAARTER